MDPGLATTGIDVGTVIADTYRVTGLLGRGGMGAVWAAEHLRIQGKRVAIKVLHADVVMDADTVARFRREAEIASRLGHPNIVGVHDLNTLPGGKPYLVLDYLEGESLDVRMRAGPIAVDDTLHIIRQVGSALRAAHHAQVIHRDLKPQNVFLATTSDGADELAKVLDFGISKIRGSQTLRTQDSTILGTPQYMAPEQAVGNHAAVDARTDVFALGVMTYEMLSGRPPFVGETIPEVVFKIVYEPPPPLGQLAPGLPQHMVDAVHRALAKAQADRFPDVESFVTALTGEPMQTGRRARPSVSDPARRVPTAKDKMIGTADTIDSARLSAEATLASPGTGAPGEPTLVTRPRSRNRWWVALALAIVAGGLVAAWQAGLVGTGDDGAGEVATPAPTAGTATGEQKPDPPTAPPPVAATSVDAAPVAAVTVDAAPVAAKVDAGGPAQTPTLAGKQGKDRPRDPKPPTTGDLAPTPATSPETQADLTAARDALAAGDAGSAIRLATRALRNGGGSRAQAIKAQAYCLKQDLSNARANYINLSGSARRQVVRFCAAQGIELD